MLEQEFERLYLKFRLLHYRDLFQRIREKSGSLSATEALSAEVIYLLGQPTVKEFADFLNISQSNATYKINSLTAKGHVVRVSSSDDKREYRLQVTDRFLGYYGNNAGFIRSMMENIRADFTQEEIDELEKIIKRVSDEALN
ncbi:MAG: MarR family winged helix-turn-helix transcriptional regulator [Candidatus Heteroscillospira sp.]|jgi:DNA-binding MarR family transcriptional regulator